MGVMLTSVWSIILARKRRSSDCALGVPDNGLGCIVDKLFHLDKGIISHPWVIIIWFVKFPCVCMRICM